MADPLIGREIGNYRIEEPIGEGGMGAVYKAVHSQIGNVVAIKVLGLGREASSKDQARFLSEAKTTATLNHTNIVRIHDFVILDGIYYMLMEYVEGESLEELLSSDERVVPLSRAATVLALVARALDYAHNRGIVHRDVKPSNILIAKEDERVVLTDFGIAKLTEGTAIDLTRDGAAIGTPTYMSPEQAKGLQVGPASDIYSLGVVLYRMVTGEAPFSGSAMEVLSQHAARPPKPPRELNPNLTRRQESIILQALEKEAEKRYDRSGELAAAFVGTITGAAEVAIETGSKWERFREGQTWGRVLRVARFFQAASTGLLGILLRSLLSLSLGVVVVLLALLAGLSIFIGNSLEQVIADRPWGFDRVGPGYQQEYSPDALGQALEFGATQFLPGTFSEVSVIPRSATAVTIAGMLQGTPINLDISVSITDDKPLFTLERLNGYPLPIVGSLVARGLNNGFATALDNASASIPSLQIGPDAIIVTIDGSGTQTVEVLASTCEEGVVLSEDFSDIYSGWAQSYATEQAEVGYKQGAYSLKTSAANIIVNQALPCRFSDFVANVEVQPIGDPGDASWGIIFFELDPDNYWVFQINALGWFSVERVLEGEQELVVPWEQTNEIEQEGVNTLRVTMLDQGEIFANDVSLATFNIPEDVLANGGYFGLLLRSGNQPAVEISFDNLEVVLPQE
ncbi:MAG: serine/threonine protein kinase [Anaerolineales bacterium]